MRSRMIRQSHFMAKTELTDRTVMCGAQFKQSHSIRMHLKYERWTSIQIY